MGRYHRSVDLANSRAGLNLHLAIRRLREPKREDATGEYRTGVRKAGDLSAENCFIAVARSSPCARVPADLSSEKKSRSIENVHPRRSPQACRKLHTGCV